MSEVSESLHLWRTTRATVCQLVDSSGIALRIVASNERWTTVVSFEDDELEPLAERTPSLSLLWSYFADFGLRLTFGEGRLELGRLEWWWARDSDEDEAPPPSGRLLVRLREEGVIASVTALDDLAAAVRAQKARPRDFRDQAARAFALPAYAWLSPRSCRETPLERAVREFPLAEDCEPRA